MPGLRICGERWETRAQRFPDLVLDLVGVTRATDQHYAIWLTRGKIAVCLANALVKLVGLLLHPILSTRFLHSRRRAGRIDIENKGNVRNALADCKRIQTLDHLTI